VGFCLPGTLPGPCRDGLMIGASGSQAQGCFLNFLGAPTSSCTSRPGTAKQTRREITGTMRRIPRIRRDAAVLQPSSALRSANPQRRLVLALPSSRTFTTTPISSTPTSRRSTWASPKPTQWRQYSTAPKDEKTAELQSVEDAQLAEIEAVSAELDEYYEAEPDIETDLVLPGDVEIAPNPSQVPDPEYVPALTGDGLEEVGGLQGYWEDDSHWTESKEIQIFGRKDKVTDPAVLEVLTRQAVVESLAVQGQEGSGGEVTLKGPWPRGGAAERAAALRVQITVVEDASASLSGDVSGVARGLVEIPDAEAAEASHELLDAGEARELVNSWDSSWKQVSLQDAALKFAVGFFFLPEKEHLEMHSIY